MLYRLYTQLPKPKCIGIGTLSVDNNKAMFFIQERLEADMDRSRLEWIQVKGIYLSGFEQIGMKENGLPKYRYQEWFIAYIENEGE